MYYSQLLIGICSIAFRKTGSKFVYTLFVRFGEDSYTYNNNGCLTSDGTHTYEYNLENQLLKVDSGSTAEYTYDYAGRRISKTIGGGTNTRYVYDGDQVIAEYDVNDTTQSHTLLRKYIYGPGIDEPICMIDELDNKFYSSSAILWV